MQRARITDLALDLLKDHPEGMRYSELVRGVKEADSSLRVNTIHGNIWNLDERLMDRVYKPSRGLFRLTEFRDSETLSQNW